MSHIHTLSPDIIPKIAAGEVVENPASIVKELVENSIDAGAKNIIIELKSSGLKSIKIIDDGEGMDNEDLVKAVLPHTTSKIFTIEDLAAIKTLGFRGEALSSICAVSDVVIKTKTKDATSGLQLKTHNNQAAPVEPVGMNIGTIIEVSDLFVTVPARKKFLKTPSIEYRNILNTLAGIVLGNLSIGFVFYNDNKLVFKISSSDSLEIRIAKILGKLLAENIIPISMTDSKIHLHGYITKPQVSTYNRNSQFLFVNGRRIFDFLISKIAKRAYGKLLEKNAYPPFVLYLDLQPDLVDVNVHPRKEQIKFWDEDYVIALLSKAVSQTLSKNNLTFIFQESSKESENTFDYGAIKNVYEKVKDTTLVWNVKTRPQVELYENCFQIADTYIAYTDGTNLILVDQHAAHESILYADFISNYKKMSKAPTQYVLNKPLSISLTVTNSFENTKDIQTLKKLGFTSQLKKNKLIIKAVPKLFKDHNIPKLIDEFFNDFDESFPDDKTDRTIAYLSCRTAIKAGDILSQEEQRQLLKKLDALPDLYTCPHGRPIKIIIPTKNLARMFKRIK